MAAKADREQREQSRDTFPTEHNARPYDRAYALYCILQCILFYCIVLEASSNWIHIVQIMYTNCMLLCAKESERNKTPELHTVLNESRARNVDKQWNEDERW